MDTPESTTCLTPRRVAALKGSTSSSRTANPHIKKLSLSRIPSLNIESVSPSSSEVSSPRSDANLLTPTSSPRSSTSSVSCNDSPATSPRSPRNTHSPRLSQQQSQQQACGAPSTTAHIKDTYTIGKQIGAGSGGKVHVGENTATGDSVAIKIVRKGAGNSEKHARKESMIMKSLQHAHIVSLEEFEETPKHLFLVMEYAKGGDLFDYMQNHTKATGSYALPPHLAWRWFSQLASALTYAHSVGVVHRDIKPENIFIDDIGNIKLGDWGYSTFWSSTKKKKKSCGSSYYASPEILLNRPYTGPEVDIFSLGGVLYTMLTGGLPFGYVGRDAAVGIPAARRAVAGAWIPCSTLSDTVSAFLNKMMHPSPLSRATLYDVFLFMRQFDPEQTLASSSRYRAKSLDDETSSPRAMLA